MTTIDENILIQYIDRTLSKQEQTEVEDWLAASSDNEKQLEQLYFTLEVANRVRVMKSVDPEMALLRFKSRLQKKNKKINMYHAFQMMQRIAAVLFIPVLVLSAYLLMQQDGEEVRMLEVHTNPGVVSQIDLPDGSKVWLNANSVLKYPSNFQAGNRKVELNGQAYFEVTKNPEKPFIVKADNTYSVEVLGTSFNLSAYADEDVIETTLVEGSVKLNVADAAGKEISRKLKPNEKAEFQKNTNQLEISTVNTDYDTAWKSGEIIFRNHSMDQVMKILSRHYNVKFEVKDAKVLNSIITARFKNEQLPQVMEYLHLASGVIFHIRKPSVTSNHTLEIPIIEISK